MVRTVPGSNRAGMACAIFSTERFGMSLFFALSGFVITYNYVDLDWRHAPFASLRRFAWLRFTRLYPALLAFIIISAIFRHSARDLGWWTIIDLLCIQTWTPWFTPALYGPLMLAWSISTEVAMYLMFAGLMMLPFRIRVMAIVFYLACVIWAGAVIDEPALSRWFFYFSPYVRFIEFGLGALAALFVLRHRIEDGGIAHRILGSRPLVFVGTISYSLYLFQDVGAATAARMLGLRIFGYVTSPSFSAADVPLLLMNLGIGIAIALALAYAGYRWIERPAQLYLRSFGRRPALIPARTLAASLAVHIAGPALRFSRLRRPSRPVV